jgi:hypothetical protein
MYKQGFITATCIGSVVAFSALTGTAQEPYYSDGYYPSEQVCQEEDEETCCCISGDCDDNWMETAPSYPSRIEDSWYDRLTR